MNSVMAAYDIPQSLKITNPSCILRRFGIRVNLSCWIFPNGKVPTDVLDRLRCDGATVHLIEFAEQSQEKILDLARSELRRHANAVVKYVNDRTGEMKQRQTAMSLASDEAKGKFYRKWRGIVGRARRELVSAQQCAFAFGLTQDVETAFESLRHVLTASLNEAIAWNDSGASPAPDVLKPSSSWDNGTWVPSAAV